jgi:DNA-binding MarR family transcriptional regulator
MQGSARPELQGRAVRELAIVHQLAFTRLNRALRPLGLTMTHTSLLFHLAGQPDGCPVGEIADAMEVNQPAVSKTVRALADRGAVGVETVADDGRRRLVRLTAEGRRLLGEAMAAMHPEATVAFGPLDDERLRQLADALAEVRVTLDAVRDGSPPARTL